MPTIRNKKPKIGRNEICPICKSGLKFKHCHGDWTKLKRCEGLIWPLNKIVMNKLIKKELKHRAANKEKHGVCVGKKTGRHTVYDGGFTNKYY